MLIRTLKSLFVSPEHYFNVPGTGSGPVPVPDDDEINDIIHQFTYGDCGVFAVAMHHHYAYPIVGFFIDQELYHVAVAINDNTFMDVQGIQTAMSIYTRYNDDFLEEPPEIVEMTIRDVHFYNPYTTEQLDDANQALAQMITAGKLPLMTMTNDITSPSTELNETPDSLFQFQSLDFKVLVPEGKSFDRDMLYGAELVATIASSERCDVIYKEMTSWLQSDAAIVETNNTDNPCAIMRIEHKGAHLVLAFDMGGSDNCGFQLIQHSKGLETLSRAHGYPEDIVSFVDEYQNTTLSASI